jgi:hypothetical protein
MKRVQVDALVLIAMGIMGLVLFPETLNHYFLMVARFIFKFGIAFAITCYAFSVWRIKNLGEKNGQQNSKSSG